ncbi:MAG TPA: D-alanyl-D-alanine carboxypeptidase/D-alanyl-D-alanine-endopeptidase [Candidatus Sumerlaeota bacterium]|nr:D-alanyl-D-alanine carboxypeptidase/D-alanyl-D-alanine-endopeptidase [Candidatus Sumerlaeota bacterium]
MKALKFLVTCVILVTLAGCCGHHAACPAGSRGVSADVSAPPAALAPSEPDAEKTANPLAAQIADILDAPETRNAFWGVYIKRAGEEAPLFALNEERGFMPASNMKIYTTSAALCKLGKDHVFHTGIFYRGAVDGQGILNGDLIIRGSGDPSISGRYRDGVETQAILAAWAEAVKAAGIKVIRGRVIADSTYFSDNGISSTWENGYLTDWYAAPSSALSVDDNWFLTNALPGEKVGDPIRIEPLETAYVTLKNDAVTSVSSAADTLVCLRQIEGNIVTVSGWLPLGSERSRLRGCVYDGSLYAATLVREALIRNGIPVAGTAADAGQMDPGEIGAMYDSATLVHTHVSPPLSEIIAIVNKPSQNFYADMLLKVLGKQFAGDGSFSAGRDVVRDFLRSIGAPNIEDFTMVDGSGLGRKNLVQPRQSVRLLEYMTTRRDFTAFYDSLPIAGMDGTTGGRMKNTPALGNVHAKTGFITGARALSGYVDDQDGNRWIFSMMCNNFTCPVGRIDAIIDRVCVALASSGGE